MLAAAPAGGEENGFPIFPPGGKTLLIQLIKGDLPAPELMAIVTAKRTRAEWQSYLESRQAAIPALKGLDEKQQLTLADYLYLSMPLPAASVPADPSQANWYRLLPRDGRELAMENCQSCHIIKMVMTRERSKEAWLGTLQKPRHVKIDLTGTEREALASFLGLNAGIPIRGVPENLRAAAPPAELPPESLTEEARCASVPAPSRCS
jgi:mono/diheme cytochrome c family protein